jgi:hypothetical protein
MQQVGELGTGANISEGHCRENKRSRMQCDAAVQPSPAQFLPTYDNQGHPPPDSSPDTPQLSTSTERPSDTIDENNISLHDIITTLEILSRSATTNSSPKSPFSEPLPPTHMDPPVATATGEILTSGASTSNEYLGPLNMDQTPDTGISTANSANPELQRQLVQTWDVKRVRELEQQGE